MPTFVPRSPPAAMGNGVARADMVGPGERAKMSSEPEAIVAAQRSARHPHHGCLMRPLWKRGQNLRPAPSAVDRPTARGLALPECRALAASKDRLLAEVVRLQDWPRHREHPQMQSATPR